MTRIYTDTLGIPVYEATISRIGDYWIVNTTADTPYGRYETIDDAIDAVIADGWVVVTTDRDGFGYARAQIWHTDTKAAYDKRVQARKDKWGHAIPCYVRYGDLPTEGISHNHSDGIAEAGVSVFRGEVLPSGEARAIPTGDVDFCTMIAISDRDMYIVAGREVGTGSDGEPVLADCYIVAKAK